MHVTLLSILSAAILVGTVAAQQPSARGLPVEETCYYECPATDSNGHALTTSVPTSTVHTTFSCIYEDENASPAIYGHCVYQISTGVLTNDDDGRHCRAGATSLVSGCTAGQTKSLGRRRRNVVRAKKVGGRSSRELQQAALKKAAKKRALSAKMRKML